MTDTVPETPRQRTRRNAANFYRSAPGREAAAREFLEAVLAAPREPERRPIGFSVRERRTSYERRHTLQLLELYCADATTMVQTTFHATVMDEHGTSCQIPFVYGRGLMGDVIAFSSSVGMTPIDVDFTPSCLNAAAEQIEQMFERCSPPAHPERQ